MNVILDVLRLRRVKLDYISPPVCQVILSGSGSSLMLEAVTSPEPPANLAFSGQCNRFLTWTNPRNAACVTLYKAVNPDDPVTPFTPVTDCVPVGYASVCSPGWWKYRTLTEDGEISEYSAPIFVPGGIPVVFQIVQIQSAVRYELYKNHNPTDPNAEYRLVMSGTNFHVIEVCEATGCYRAQVITDDGPSSLSNPICRTSEADCCPPPGCPMHYNWDSVLCSCVPGDLISDVVGPLPNGCEGVAYSSFMTVLGGTGPFLWELVSGSAPPGVNIHTGLFVGNTAPIDGTPAASGEFSFTIRCTASDSSSIEKTFSINVVGITQGALLPGGVTDTPYSEQLVGQGGIAPYSFTLESGVLPTGLSMSPDGLISGTPFISESQNIVLGVTDANGITCDVPEIIQITGCPNVNTYPAIATGGPVIQLAGGGLDLERRILWALWSGFSASPPYRLGPYLIDTSSLTLMAGPTDPLNLINSLAKGRTNPVLVVDSKYNQVITGHAHWTWYNAITRQAEAVNQPWGYPDWQQDYTAYDEARGYVYVSLPAIGGQLQINIVDCDPTIRNTIFTTPGVGGFTSSSIAYSPVNDTCYLANAAGPTLLHKWDPVGHAFTTNTGPNTGLTAIQVFWIRGINRILVNTSVGTCYVLDPANGDAIEATFVFDAGITIQQPEYNECNGLVYIFASVSPNAGHLFDPSSGWADLGVIPGVSTDEVGLQKFDQYSNRLFTLKRADSTIHTYP